MRVLGIDPGMLRLGFAGVSTSEDDELSLITYGLIANPRDPNHTFNQHLTRSIHQIADDMPRVFDLIRPDIVVAEIVPVGRLGSNTELVVGAISTCKVIAYQFGVPWHDVGATTVKKDYTDNAKATKAQIRRKVFEQFPVTEERHQKLKSEQKRDGQKADGLPFDVFDAIAIAVVGIQIHGNENMRTVPEGKEGEAVHSAEERGKE